MARVTVEDCVRYVPNRFELVIMAAKRARQLVRGRESLVPLENDKWTVVALREIGEGMLDTEQLLFQEEEPVSTHSLDQEGDAAALLEDEIHIPGVAELGEDDDLLDDDEGDFGSDFGSDFADFGDSAEFSDFGEDS